MTVSTNKRAARHSTGLTAAAAAGLDLSEWASDNKDFIRAFVAFTIGGMLLSLARACTRPLPRVSKRPGTAGPPADDQPAGSASPDDSSQDNPSPSV